MLLFYFTISSEEIDSLEIDDWLDKYDQLIYALEFDGRRSSGDAKKPAKLPL